MNPETYFYLMNPHLALAAPIFSLLLHTLPASRHSCALILKISSHLYILTMLSGCDLFDAQRFLRNVFESSLAVFLEI